MSYNKIAGAIYGQFIGDALGTRYEFEPSKNASTRIHNDKLKTNDNILPILGEGPFNLIPGQVTDDTELAMGLMYSILENGKFDPELCVKKYIKWYNSDPFDIGNTTRNSFTNSSTYQQVIKRSSELNKSSLSNGCLMRISPLGIYGLKFSDDHLLKLCYYDTIITNPHAYTIDAVGCYCIALKTALSCNDKQLVFDRAFQYARTQFVRDILLDATKYPSPTRTISKTAMTTDSQQMGYFGIALQNAFYELLYGKSFESSLENIIARGGDTDTNGCIAGALLGAYYGKNNIPEKWISSVTIYNPRCNDYPEIDQRNIQNIIDSIHKLVTS